MVMILLHSMMGQIINQLNLKNRVESWVVLKFLAQVISYLSHLNQMAVFQKMDFLPQSILVPEQQLQQPPQL